MEKREMYNEIATLVGSIAKALSLPEQDTIKALEAGEISMSMEEDDQGKHYVGLEYQGKKARLYKSAIFHEDEQAPTEEKH